MNLALGSVLATIGLTIPAVAGVSILLNEPLTLGLSAKEELLLALTLIVSLLTIGTGRTTVLQGIVHLIIFAVFLFLSRSEEHTSELQSLTNLVCRLLLEKKKKI